MDTPYRRATASQVTRRRRIEAEGVDDGGEVAPGPVLDDLVEDGEGVVTGRQIILALADDRPQAVARHDLVGGEVLGRPRRFAGAGRAHEHHQARRRQHDIGHAGVLLC